jgi:hypothetical protein
LRDTGLAGPSKDATITGPFRSGVEKIAENILEDLFITVLNSSVAVVDASPQVER